MALFDNNRRTREMRFLTNDKAQKYFTPCDYIETIFEFLLIILNCSASNVKVVFNAVL